MTAPALTPAALLGALVPLDTGPDAKRRLRACRCGHTWAVLRKGITSHPLTAHCVKCRIMLRRLDPRECARLVPWRGSSPQ